MSNTTVTTKEEKVTTFMANGKEVKLTPKMVMNFIAKGNTKVTEQEVVMFINLCKFQELNPFINEAYLIKFGATAQLVIAKEVYEKRAESTTTYEGRKSGLIVQRGDNIIEVEGEFKLKSDILLGGWAEVHRSDRKFPFVAKVSLAEYDKGQSTWKTHPCTMIRKTAIAHALKEAFPKLVVDGALDEEPTQKEIAYNNIDNNANQGVIIDMMVDESEVNEIEKSDEELEHERALQEALQSENMDSEEVDF